MKKSCGFSRSDSLVGLNAPTHGTPGSHGGFRGSIDPELSAKGSKQRKTSENKVGTGSTWARRPPPKTQGMKGEDVGAAVRPEYAT